MDSKLEIRDWVGLIALSAIWGASFFFLRLAAPVFGPVPLIAARVFFGFCLLLPVFLYRGLGAQLLQHWRIVFVISLANMSLPFSLLAYASLQLNAGITSILNATVPFFAAIIAFSFWSVRLSRLALVGMGVGFSGVVLIVFDPHAIEFGPQALLSIGAGLLASLLYGTASNLAQHRLQGVSGLTVTVGSLGFATLTLAPLAWWQWPQVAPSTSMWAAVLALGSVCTGVAYLIFYKLIARIGAARALNTTFMVPAFSLLWSSTFLGEPITAYMLGGCGLILFGVALTTGKIIKP
ncbi:MAG: DMT family transporter [Gammaproteobacteria bacterium]|jgi:drug/metabolite transporter (DMT)-like permease|nr:DMT family transporter [Gammaproteobacteria bacterium]